MKYIKEKRQKSSQSSKRLDSKEIGQQCSLVAILLGLFDQIPSVPLPCLLCRVHPEGLQYLSEFSLRESETEIK